MIPRKIRTEIYLPEHTSWFAIKKQAAGLILTVSVQDTRSQLRGKCSERIPEKFCGYNSV